MSAPRLQRLSHSRAGVMQTCGLQYKFKYVDRLEPVVQSSNLAFGKAIHAATAGFLTGQALGVSLDPVEIFEAEWNEATREPITYSSIWSEEEMRASGKRMVELFAEDWQRRGWVPALDRNGLPLIERSLKVLLPGNIEYQAVIDIVAKTPDGQTIITDVKTPSQIEPEGFLELSGQLTSYQAVVEANLEQLGLERVDGLVFYNLVKKPMPKTSRGSGPQVYVPEPAELRGPGLISDWVQEMQAVANDIRAKRFYRRPRDAYSTPCDLCDFKALCLGRATPNQYRVREAHNPNGMQKAA